MASALTSILSMSFPWKAPSPIFFSAPTNSTEFSPLSLNARFPISVTGLLLTLVGIFTAPSLAASLPLSDSPVIFTPPLPSDTMAKSSGFSAMAPAKPGDTKTAVANSMIHTATTEKTLFLLTLYENMATSFTKSLKNSKTQLSIIIP